MARFTEWNEDLERALAEPFARELHEQKGGKGTFVSWEHYVRRLNELVGVAGWTIHAPLAFHAGNKLGLAVGVTILGVTRWDVGDEMEDHGEPDDDGKVRDYGSSCTNAFAQALKRACSKFGLGLYMYDKDATKAWLAGRGVAPKPAVQAWANVEKRDQMRKLLAERGGAKAGRDKIEAALKDRIADADADKMIAWLKDQPVAQEAAA